MSIYVRRVEICDIKFVSMSIRFIAINSMDLNLIECYILTVTCVAYFRGIFLGRNASWYIFRMPYSAEIAPDVI